MLQSQDVYLEVWKEKDALSSIFTQVCSPYCISVVVSRGFTSTTYLNNYRERLIEQNGKKPVLLYFGDFDPSGLEIPRAIEATLKEKLGVRGLVFKRVALLEEDIFKYKLPHDPKDLKETDKRAKKHIERYGALVAELAALRPDVLKQKIKEGVEAEINMEAFNKEVAIHKDELDEIGRLKERAEELLPCQEDYMF